MVICYSKENICSMEICGVLLQSTSNPTVCSTELDRKAGESFEEKANAQGAGDQGMMFGYATNETEPTICSLLL